MPQPLVSVVIPAYNMAAYLEETLRSVLASDYTPLEVVVVDDGSTDNTADIARRFAATDTRLRLLSVENGGVCRARNYAVRQSKGELILPIDADDLIEPDFIRKAVAAIAKADVKVVVPRADFFGDRTGEWKLPAFNLQLLARKNMLPVSCLYRRADWERAGGYSEDIVAREDWEFWISVLKDGGRVVQLTEVGLHYRVRQGSKRFSDRQKKRSVVKSLNQKHAPFFERELGGQLHYHRSWSHLLNALYRFLHPRRVRIAPDFAGLRYFVRSLPAQFRFGAGEVIYDRRNQLRRFHWLDEDYVVKSFRIPNLWGRLIYGWLRPSKAQRSFEYAALLRREGIGSPEPVAWLTERSGLLFGRSYYVSRASELPHTYADLIGHYTPDNAPILREVGRVAGRMHERGMIHRDFSRGNILYLMHEDGRVEMEIIDLNRIRFHKVSLEEGLRNLKRLPATPEMLHELAAGYAEARHADPTRCLRLLEASPREAYNA